MFRDIWVRLEPQGLHRQARWCEWLKGLYLVRGFRFGSDV